MRVSSEKGRFTDENWRMVLGRQVIESKRPEEFPPAFCFSKRGVASNLRVISSTEMQDVGISARVS